MSRPLVDGSGRDFLTAESTTKRPLRPASANEEGDPRAAFDVLKIARYTPWVKFMQPMPQVVADLVRMERAQSSTNGLEPQRTDTTLAARPADPWSSWPPQGRRHVADRLILQHGPVSVLEEPIPRHGDVHRPAHRIFDHRPDQPGARTVGPGWIGVDLPQPMRPQERRGGRDGRRPGLERLRPDGVGVAKLHHKCEIRGHGPVCSRPGRRLARPWNDWFASRDGRALRGRPGALTSAQ